MSQTACEDQWKISLILTSLSEFWIHNWFIIKQEFLSDTSQFYAPNILEMFHKECSSLRLTSQMLSSSFGLENAIIRLFDPKQHWFHSTQPIINNTHITYTITCNVYKI